jgi:hypothetical protein
MNIIKRIKISLLLIVMCYSQLTTAQTPMAIPYQAVARNNAGNLIANQPISLRFSIRDLSAVGSIVYQETHSVSTNNLGLFSVHVGQGTPSIGSFVNISWGVNSKFLQVEFDSLGGSNFIDMGTQQMMSVPYALFSGKSGDLPAGNNIGNTLRWNGTSWIADSTLANTGSRIGIGTSIPDNSAALEINSTDKGFLLPRMTTIQREAIVNPSPGLLIYNLDNNCIELRSPSSWLSFCSTICTPLPSTANAGSDQLVSSSIATLSANIPTFGIGSWSIIAGTGGSFSDTLNNASQFTGTNGLYILRWTITTTCGSSIGDVHLLFDCPSGLANCNGLITDGCEINLTTDINNCNACGNSCVNLFPNASSTCSLGICTFISCLPGFYNIDGNTVNGCEYACTFSNATDIPDDNYMDVNCDGIDGTESLAIFVSKSGSNANPGTKALPKLTIAAGITAAISGGKSQVLISNGTYNEKITLSNGISLYGGYSSTSNWVRSPSDIVIVNSNVLSGGRIIGIEGTNITSATTVDDIDISTSNNSASNGSNYGFYCSNCPNLTIKNCSITAGSAGPGVAGTSGTNGTPGNTGNVGLNGSCDGNGAGPIGGTGGTSSCGRSGGNGGQAGGTTGSASGQSGSSGIGGASGGNGGIAGDPGGDGSNGNSGAVATVGLSGTGGSGGTLTANYWLSSSGGSGTIGTHGNGGGGGGGGGSQICAFCDDGYGNSGGGGGAGGCLGTAGTGGTGGGGSFGLFLINSTGLLILNNTISTGNGGAGGAGGAGGTGGAGGLGGNGGNICTSQVGKGGNGGNGSAGGNGGSGAGGAGGPSYSIARKNTTLTTTGNTFYIGTGGNGGSTPGGGAGAVGGSGTNLLIP